MKLKSTIGLAIVCGLAAAGCGGGGTAGVSYNPGSALPAINHSITLTYTLSNVSQAINGGTAKTLSNSIGTVFISAPTKTSNYAEIQTIDNISASTPVSISRAFLLSQDGTTNALTFAGIVDSGGNQQLAGTTASYLPGTLASGATGTGASTLGSSGTYSLQYSIGAPTTVTIGLGTFNNVYPVTATYVINGTTYTGTYYYDANILSFVKSSETITQVNGTDRTVTSFNTELSAFSGATP